MNWNEYVEKAKITALYKSKKELVACTFLGLFEELHELDDAWDHYRQGTTHLTKLDLKKECGDCFWYLAILSNYYNYSPVANVIDDTFELHIDLGPFCQSLKKTIREHDWEFQDEIRYKTFCSSIDKLYNKLMNICGQLDFNPSDVWALNIEKLADRAERGAIHGDGDNR